MTAKLPKQTHSCLFCGKSFVGKRTAKYCSNYCRQYAFIYRWVAANGSKRYESKKEQAYWAELLQPVAVKYPGDLNETN